MRQCVDRWNVDLRRTMTWGRVERSRIGRTSHGRRPSASPGVPLAWRKTTSPRNKGYLYQESLRNHQITPQHQPGRSLLFVPGNPTICSSVIVLVLGLKRVQKISVTRDAGSQESLRVLQCRGRSWSKMTWCLNISKKHISNQSSISAPWGIPRNNEDKWRLI